MGRNSNFSKSPHAVTCKRRKQFCMKNYVEIDIGLDFNALVDYFKEVKENYQHRMWTLNDNVFDADKHKASDVYGWGIQSNLIDIDQPCPPYNISKDKLDYYRDTELVLGYIKELKNKFKTSTQWSIAGHPPGTKISKHTDSSEYLKIHIPIQTNTRSFFIFDDEKVVFVPGKVYLVNTSMPHGTENLGDTDRIHLFFKVLASDYERFY